MQRQNEVSSIQYLRGLAALMVVFHHCHATQPFLFDPIRGFNLPSSGVDIFFVISGFIMWLTSRHLRPLEFVAKRIVRIAPLYWVLTGVLVALVLVTGKTNTVVTWGNVIQTLLFIPHYSLAFPGFVWPILTVGWTLQFEMFFYALFAIGLAFKRPLAFSAAAIVGLIVFGWVAPPDGAILKTYTGFIMIEFVAGMCLGYFFTAHKLPSALGWLIVPGVLGLVASDYWAGHRVIEWGIPAIMIVTGAVALESRMRNIAVFKIFGDASYSIYLSHPLVLIAVDVAFKDLPISGWPQFLTYAPVAFVACIVGGLLTYRYLEKPMTFALRRQRRSTSASPQPVPNNT